MSVAPLKVRKPEIDPNQIVHAQRCASCQATQIILAESKEYVDVPSGFPIPKHVEIERLTPRWCNSCNDDTRFIEPR